jgi:hypothetical protein
VSSRLLLFTSSDAFFFFLPILVLFLNTLSHLVLLCGSHHEAASGHPVHRRTVLPESVCKVLRSRRLVWNTSFSILQVARLVFCPSVLVGSHCIVNILFNTDVLQPRSNKRLISCGDFPPPFAAVETSPLES